MRTHLRRYVTPRRFAILLGWGLLVFAGLALSSLLRTPAMPSHAGPIDRMIQSVTGGPGSPILAEIDAAHVTLNRIIWGDGPATELGLRVACDHLTRAADLAGEPEMALDQHLRHRVAEVRDTACEHPDPSATAIHDELEQLYADIAENSS